MHFLTSPAFNIMKMELIPGCDFTMPSIRFIGVNHEIIFLKQYILYSHCLTIYELQYEFHDI